MAAASTKTREIRFAIGDELTHVYVLIDAIGDCPLGVQGWHHKAFGPSRTCEDILHAMFTTDSCVLWPQAAPDPHQATKEP